MARTSAKAKKSKQEVNKKKEEAKQEDTGNKTDNEGPGDSTDKENDSLNYDVEKITHTRIFKGKRQYLVRWKNYNEDSDTWENESVLQSCKEALDAFKKEHPVDENSDDNELSEKEEEENDKNKNKKGGKKISKKGRKSGKSSKLKKEVEDSQTGTETEEEETAKEIENETLNKKMKRKTTEKIAKEESQSDNEVEEETSKKKEVKGKKRNSAKETESSKPKKAKKDESDDESVTDGKDYEVEKILEVHTRKDGSREFLIRWKGYRPSDDTWEPEAHLDCLELIEKFMEKVDKAKEMSRKELREIRTQTKRFVPMSNRTGRGSRSQRNKGLRPCYQETLED